MMIRKSLTPIAGLISAEFLSLLGNQVAAIAIPILVMQYTRSTMITGIAVAANTIPYVIAAFTGGRAIDKFGARTVSIAADLLSFISVLALPLAFILYSGNVSAALIFFLVFAGALFDPTGMISRHTLIPILTRLGKKRLDNINTLRGGLENAADFIGPAIGVGLIGLIGINNTFFVDAASFLLCATIIAFAVPKKNSNIKEKQRINIMFGIRFIFKNTKLRTLAVIGSVAGSVISAFLGLLLSVLSIRHYNNYALYGLSMSAFGISSTCSALSFSKLNGLFSHSFIYYGGLLIMGLGILLCGVVSTQYAIVGCLTFAGLAGLGNPLEQTILQEETPSQFAGQVFAALPAIRFFAGTLGILFAGILTASISVNTVLTWSGGLLIVTALSGWIIAPLKQHFKG